MMGKTHIAVGTACALALVGATGAPGCVAAVIGGSLGSIVCDIDTKSNDYCKDARHARIIALVIAGVACIVGIALDRSIVSRFTQLGGIGLAVVGIMIVAMIVFSRISKHRSFSHSVLAFFLWMIPLLYISPLIALAFGIGFISHILLDLLNKKPVRVFFPLKAEFCTKLCYADKAANKALMILGTVASVVLLIACILNAMGALT